MLSCSVGPPLSLCWALHGLASMWNTQKPSSLSKVQAPQSVFDIAAGHAPSLLGASIVESLYLKGFCTIDLGLGGNLAEQAVKNVNVIWDADRFEPTPPLLYDGLLGEQGSSQIAPLRPSDFITAADGEALEHLDNLITDTGAVIAPLVAQLDFEIEDRTVGLLHQTGAAKPGSNATLTDLEAQKWLTQFWWQRILVLVFLGPDEGNLELVPYEDDEANSHDFTTKPGMMVIMRPDALAGYHTSKGRSITLSATFMQPVSRPKPRTCPCVNSILDFITQRMKLHTAEDSLNTAVPREFQRMARHLFHKGPRTSVIACPGRFPTTWDCDSWLSSLTSGPDVVVHIPNMRWDHEVDHGNYDANPESWRWGLTNIRHGAFCDGLELFDNRFFNLSLNESRGMDPGQRLILEVSYEGLWSGGLRKKDIHNSATSVYVGHTSAEWNWADRTEESRASPGSGSVMCIYSNRVNYALGLKGPSISVDQEGASAMTAVHLCCISVMDVWSNGERKGGAICGHGVGLGSYLILANRALSLQTASGCLTAVGRCLTFDASASGLARSEGVSGCIVKPLAKYVDGEPVIHEKGWPPQGVLASTGTNCSGMAANVRAPHGPAIQEIIGNALEEARISALDVDVAEVHGEGRLMSDVVDIGTALFALRASPDGAGMQQMPELVIGSVKSNVGHAKENAAAFALIRAIMASQLSAATPNCHLRTVNPNLDTRGLEELALVNSEMLLASGSASFTNVTAHGFGGSNSNAIVWNTTELHGKVVKNPPPLDRQFFVFWPGGGGELEDEATDCQAYHILGSWSNWEEAEPMEPEGEGIFGYTVALGENGFEEFQILLDGDDQRVLHPGQPFGLKNSNVYGPNESWESEANTWAIDGRKQLSLHAPADVVTALMAEGAVWDNVPAGALVDTTDTAQPGEAFRVRLKIAGKWRVVTWDKIR
uniref:Type I polyketide synthase n=1 Tax=Gambierdiscus excentricus TaxID=986170 RepID=A0A1S6K846_9DINO|nr:type I polyketide synthase [Gambierdiscus excentricus]